MIFYVCSKIWFCLLLYIIIIISVECLYKRYSFQDNHFFITLESLESNLIELEYGKKNNRKARWIWW